MRFSNRAILTGFFAAGLAVAAAFAPTGNALASSGPSITIIDGPNFDVCTANTTVGNAIQVTITASINAPASDVATITVPGAGTVFSAGEDDSASNGTYSYAVYTNSYSVPANTPITFSITTYNGPGETGGVSYVSTATINCTTGGLLSVSSHAVTSTTASSVPGPGVPAGFVLKTVSCTTPVFNAPGDHQVGSNQLVAGQTWFASPTPVKDTKGTAWTEVFVGGYTDGYVLTNCLR